MLAFKGGTYIGKGKCHNGRRETHTDTEVRIFISENIKMFQKKPSYNYLNVKYKTRSVLSSLHRFIFECWIIKRLSVFCSSLKPEIASILAQMSLMLVYFSTPYLSSPNGLLSSCKWDILISVHPNFSEQVCVWLHLL